MFDDPNKMILLPGVYDALVARLAEVAGFDAMAHSGFGTAAAREAVPDIGLISFGEMVEQVREISRGAGIPLVADADTGYGNAVSVYHTVQEYIYAGAAGLFIEDQVWPKRCGHMYGKQIISLSEMTEKIKAALKARDEIDPDFIIGGRTDAIAVTGFEDALKRGKKFEELGMDFVFLEAPVDMKQMQQITKEIHAPLMLNQIEGGKTPIISVEEARELGFRIVVFPLTTLMASTKAILEVLKVLKEKGTTTTVANRLTSFEDFVQNIVGNKKFTELAQQLKEE